MSFAKMSEQYEALSSREKILVLLSPTAVIIGVVFLLLIEPKFLAAQAVADKLAKSVQLQAQNQRQILELQGLLSAQPVQSMQGEFEVLEAEQIELAAILAQMNLAVLSPQQFTDFLTEILAGAKHLQVENFQLITEVYNGEDEFENYDDELLIKQNIRLRLQGVDVQLIAYLKQLESMPVSIGWDSISYQTLAGEQRDVTIALHLFSVIE
ncbi:MAG: type II secretion system protein M [Oceanospirillaceae bacterium]|nr:type II secretion system protein M [Oceanospirillaceae bacterium]